jgi:hypothetical protein
MPSSARLQELVDRQDIYDCLVRICRGTDRFDREQFLSGFHGDATIQSGSFSGKPDEIYAGGAAAHDESTKFTLHCLSSHGCEITGDSAHAETYYLYNANNRDGTNWSAAGRYLDRFERRGGIWRIMFRCITVEWSGKLLENVIPMFDDLTNDPAVLMPSRDGRDPSYRRPLGG